MTSKVKALPSMISGLPFFRLRLRGVRVVDAARVNETRIDAVSSAVEPTVLILPDVALAIATLIKGKRRANHRGQAGRAYKKEALARARASP
jgi:hypothetical protein